MAQGKITASSLNLRTQPDSSSSINIIRSLPTGTLVDIIKTVTGSNYTFGSETRNDWHQVTVETDTGFIAAAWVIPGTVTLPSIPSITIEVRGAWIVDHTHSAVLTSPATISNALDFLQNHGFNTVCPAVWNRGFTAFPSTVMTSYGFPAQDPGYADFDPLKEIVKQGKSRGMMVFPWFEYGFAASPNADGGHILTTKPDWSALDSSRNKVRHGGLTWMNALNPEVQQFMLDLILEVINTYDVDGIQGCDRFPAIPFNGGYDTATKDKFGAEPPIKTTDSKWGNWVKFRSDILTQYLERVFNAVKSKKPSCIFSIAPSPFPFGRDNLMQDSDTWVKKNIVDFLHPQFYRTSFSAYKTEVDNLKARGFSSSHIKKIAPAIAFKANDINLTTSDIMQCVKYNKSQLLGGQIFFFHEGLVNNSNAMALALKATW